VDTRGEADVGRDDSLMRDDALGGIDDEDEGVWDFCEAESVRGCCGDFGGDIYEESGGCLWDFGEAESVRECWTDFGGDIWEESGRYLWGDKDEDFVGDIVDFGGRG
jgi:hypothetical protein